MTPIRALRMAWAGAIVAAASGFLYFAYAPVPGSHTADTLLAIGVAGVGAIAGGVLETRVEASLSSEQLLAEIIRPPVDVQPTEQLSVQGA